ncbi:MAG: tetratricopeptide repeat protein [Verrucomicrobiota bacterium]
MSPRLLALIFLLPAALAAEPLRDAIDLFKAQRVPEARPILEKLVAAEPRNVQARLYLARSMSLMHDRDAAIDLLADTLKLAPDNHVVLAEYGGACLHRAGELNAGLRALYLARKGRHALETAADMDRDSVVYREGLVDFYRQAPAIAGGSLAKARQHARAVARLDPVRGKLLLASLSAQEDDPAGALAICREVIAAQPDHYLALYTFGRAATDAGLALDEAERYLRRCLELTPSPSEPNHAGAYYRLGMAAEKSGRADEARAHYRKSLELEPGFTKAEHALTALN